MSARNGWSVAIASLALAALGTAVLIVGNAARDAQSREEGRRAAIAPAAAASADTGLARGGPVPKGQIRAVALTVPRFLNAFNADAGDRRLLILLSPT